jgi:hypothetical protein
MSIKEEERFRFIDFLISKYKTVESIRAYLNLKNVKGAEVKTSLYIKHYVLPQMLNREANKYKKQGCAVYDIRTKLDIVESALIAS